MFALWSGYGGCGDGGGSVGSNKVTLLDFHCSDQCFFTDKSRQECEAEAGFKPGRQSSFTKNCRETCRAVYTTLVNVCFLLLQGQGLRAIRKCTQKTFVILECKQKAGVMTVKQHIMHKQAKKKKV